MENSLLITVVIPVYNREKHIRQCLELITNQSYDNLEIIVVNDGSADGSVAIIKEFTDQPNSRVTLIEHEQNQGLSAARNTGIDNANGKYIHFMDDDDQVNLRFYERLLSAAEASNADMTACGVINQARGYKTQLFTKVTEHNSLQERLTATYVGKWGYVWRYLFRKDFLLKHELRFEEGRLIEDLPFSFAAVYHANKIVTVPKAEYLYVFTPDSIINTRNAEIRDKRRRDSLHAREFVKNFAAEHGNFEIPAVTCGKGAYVMRKVKHWFQPARETLITD